MNGYYIYIWYNNDWGDVPFYIGKGSGRRYLEKSNRSIPFTKFIERWNCSSQIILDGLDEETATSLEKTIKEQFILAGYPIIDAEIAHRRKISQKAAIKKALEKGVKFGRPSIKLNDSFEILLKKQKDGEMTVEECCAQLGISRATWYNKLKEVC